MKQLDFEAESSAKQYKDYYPARQRPDELTDTLPRQLQTRAAPQLRQRLVSVRTTDSNGDKWKRK